MPFQTDVIKLLFYIKYYQQLTLKGKSSFTGVLHLYTTQYLLTCLVLDQADQCLSMCCVILLQNLSIFCSTDLLRLI